MATRGGIGREAILGDRSNVSSSAQYLEPYGPTAYRADRTSDGRGDLGLDLGQSGLASRDSVDSTRLALQMTRSLSSSSHVPKAALDHDARLSSSGQRKTMVRVTGPEADDAVALLRPDREIKDELPPFVVQPPSSASSSRPTFDGHAVEREGAIERPTGGLEYPNDSGRQVTPPRHPSGDSMNAGQPFSQSSPSSARSGGPRSPGRSAVAGQSAQQNIRNEYSTSPNSAAAISRDRKPSAAGGTRSRNVSSAHRSPAGGAGSGFSAKQRSVSASDFGGPLGMAPKPTTTSARSRLPSSASHDPVSSLPLAAHLVPEIKEYTVPKGTKWDDAPIPTVAKRLEKERLEKEEKERQEKEARRREARVSGKENTTNEPVSMSDHLESWKDS